MSSIKFKIAIVMMMVVPTLSWGLVEKSQNYQIGFISKEDKKFFEDKVKPYWRQVMSDNTIDKVEIVLLTTYNSKGEVEISELAQKIRKSPPSMKAFYIHWNERFTPAHADWIQALNEKTQQGARVAFFAGLAQAGSKSVPLRQTMAAQVPKALILGELLDRERLPAQHYYGPELFSAFQDPAASATGLSPLKFVSRWAAHNPQSNLDESLEELRRKKQKSSRMWPTADDFFGR